MKSLLLSFDSLMTPLRRIMKKLPWAQVYVAFPYAWYSLILIAPLLFLGSLSFSEFSSGAPPYFPLWQWLPPSTWQLKLCFANYAIVLKDSFYRAAFGHSLSISALSTFLCLMIGYPMAYGISRSRYRVMWLMLAVVPFLTSFLVRVYAWMTLLTPQGLINHLITSLGYTPLKIMHTPYAVVIGVVYSYLPFMVFPLYAVLDRMDPCLLEAAYDLGCRPLSAFWRITVPLSKPGIIAGSSLVFIPAIGEYIIPELLGGPRSLTIGRLLWHAFFTSRDWPVSACIAVIMILVLMIPIFLFERLQQSFDQES